MSGGARLCLGAYCPCGYVPLATPRRSGPTYVVRHPRAVAVAIAVALLICVTVGPLAWSALRDKHTDGRWQLQSGRHGVSTGLVIEIEDNELTGEGPCNQFRTDWSQSDGASELLSTAIGCAPAVLRDEDSYFNLLTSATSIDVEDDELRMTGDNGTLVFSRVE